MGEIGSYFWLDIPVVDSDHEEADALLGQDRVYVLSGRTALDFVLRIFPQRSVVYMPLLL